jgi:hypothetical protein
VLELTHDAKGKKLKKQYGRIWHRVPLEHWEDTAGWTFRLDELLKALGLKPKGTIDTDKIEGATGMVKLRTGKDLDDNYRPEVGKVMKLSDSEDEEDDDDDDDEEPDEDEDEDEQDEEDDDDDDDDDEEAYDEEDLSDLDDDDLIEVATDEFDLAKPKGKLTAAKRKKLIAAILEAQEEAEDEDDDEEDDEDEEEEQEDYSDLSRNQLVKEARSRGLKVKKTDDEDTIREWLVADDSEEEEEDDDSDDDDEEEEKDYSDWNLPDIKAELKERGLKASGSKEVLIKRLEKDDQNQDDPF